MAQQGKPISAAPTVSAPASPLRRRVRFAGCEGEEGFAAPSYQHSCRCPSPPSPLDRCDYNDGYASDVWYAPSDLETFRDEARRHCKRIREAEQQRLLQQQQQLLLSAAPEGETCYSSDSSSSSSTSSTDAVPTKKRPSSSLLRVVIEVDGEDDEDESADRLPHSRGLEQRCCLERQRRKYLTNRCIVRAQRQLTSDQLAELARRCTSWAAELAAEEGIRDYARAYHNRRAEAPTSERCVRPRLSV